MATFNEVYDAAELDVYIAEYDDGASEWNYEKVEYLRNFAPDFPENKRRVYDGLDFKGNKPQRAENSLEIEQEFMGFDKGLYPYQNTDALLVKVEINPEEGDAPTDNIRYYTNFSTNKVNWTKSDVGEFSISLDGAINAETDTEPADPSEF